MRKSLAGLLLFALTLLSAARAPAQLPPQEMGMLKFLLGEWKGEGWLDFGRERQTFQITQTAKLKSGGWALLVEGLGTAGFPDRPERFIIHQVFTLLSYDWQAKLFRVRAYRELEGLVDAEAKVGEEELVWGYQASFPRLRTRHIRITIRRNEKKQWLEIGEESMDAGKTWRQFFEMTLNRVP
jgi:hypothetical protein